MKSKVDKASVNRLLRSDFFWIVLIAIFFTVGLVGLSMPTYREEFLPLSSFHLFLTYLVLYFGRKGKKDKFLLFSFLVFFVGLLVEAIGVNTGLLFGEYVYGKVLGAKIFGVPLIIGVNWVTMVVVCSTLVYGLNRSLWVKSLLAATFMTALDVLIEPVAINLGYWTWQDDQIPLFNYLCWFVISLPMHYFYMKWELVENNKVAKAVFLLMCFFFLTLNII